jgi:hypothetical protein
VIQTEKLDQQFWTAFRAARRSQPVAKEVLGNATYRAVRIEHERMLQKRVAEQDVPDVLKATRQLCMELDREGMRSGMDQAQRGLIMSVQLVVAGDFLGLET